MTATQSFLVGQRARTTVDAPAAWPGAWSAPAGTLGTITDSHDQWGSYGVLLDGDPDNLPASYRAAELDPAPLDDELCIGCGEAHGNQGCAAIFH